MSILYRLMDRLKSSRDNTKYYSQSGEDAIIFRLLQGSPTGSYIDIGGGDPIFGSNSYILYKHGWKGIFIEPLPRLTKLAKFYRNRDLILNIAICDTPQVVTKIYEYETSQYTTSSPLRFVELKEKGIKPINVFDIESKTLTQIIEEYGHFLSPPHVLLIDAEGKDYDILSSLDFQKYRPDVIVVETLNMNPCINQFTTLLDSLNYEFVGFTKLSSILISKDSKYF